MKSFFFLFLGAVEKLIFMSIFKPRSSRLVQILALLMMIVESKSCKASFIFATVYP